MADLGYALSIAFFFSFISFTAIALYMDHKSQKMTDKYNDDRGKKWQVIAI
ncbi:hypothetical protein [Providencia sp. Je.9.19]|uniref:hypothetical protein n=1 Tax=unclassified Providencia TaxID=2633465 RepID=UPI003DA936CE